MADASRHDNRQNTSAKNDSQSYKSQFPFRGAKRILVIGRHGSGKTTFINLAAGRKPAIPMQTKAGISAKPFRVITFTLGDHEFKLIDSPGFDNTRSPDLYQVFAKLISFLAPHERITDHALLTGIIYIHPQADKLDSDNLILNLRTLKAILGENYLPKVTVLVSHALPNTSKSGITASSLAEGNSPFRELEGANLRDFRQEKDIRDILLAYTPAPHRPQFFDAQDRFANDSIKDISSHLQECLQSAKSSLARSVPTQRNHEQKIPVEAIIVKNAEKTPEEANTGGNATENDLRSQLLQLRSEYRSLRAHLQIEENFEKSQITQQLRDLNRQIEDLGRAVSDHLSDRHSKSNDTSLNAHHLDELKTMFVHTPGKSSLVESSFGVGMPVADFFDHAVRSILCQNLYLHIFQPFHPSIAQPHPGGNFVLSLYQSIQRQEPQAVAGRWRKDTFNSISRSLGSTRMDEIKAKVSGSIKSNGFDPLLKAFFEPSIGATLEPEHLASLDDIVSAAWRWNEFLKGSVVLLGDLTPVAYKYGQDYDLDRMLEFEGTSGGKIPEYILSTIGLGMNLVCAIGEDKEPERSVFYSALVTSEIMFD